VSGGLHPSKKFLVKMEEDIMVPLHQNLMGEQFPPIMTKARIIKVERKKKRRIKKRKKFLNQKASHPVKKMIKKRRKKSKKKD